MKPSSKRMKRVVKEQSPNPYEPLREKVQRDVLEAILNGTLKPGAKIVESSLSTVLKVSRTPLRESLLMLEKEGFVILDDARGFLVAPLLPKEVREIYPLLCTLECLALQSVGIRTAVHLPELRKINKALSHASKNPLRALQLDVQWHETLLIEYPNNRLLKIHSDLRRIANRYERIYMGNASLIPFSVAQHNAIMEALEKGNMNKALQKLKYNWTFGMEALLKALGSV
jgi:DNA-binding GntR family transcriptional regulator